MAATNHGLTVYTDRKDGDVDAQRLKRPATRAITKCFNDAATVLAYDLVYDNFGHRGIDFDCGDCATVVAMYSGEVTEMVSNWVSGEQRETMSKSAPTPMLGKFRALSICTCL